MAKKTINVGESELEFYVEMDSIPGSPLGYGVRGPNRINLKSPDNSVHPDQMALAFVQYLQKQTGNKTIKYVRQREFSATSGAPEAQGIITDDTTTVLFETKAWERVYFRVQEFALGKFIAGKISLLPTKIDMLNLALSYAERELPLL
jgi:hypothetical protein